MSGKDLGSLTHQAQRTLSILQAAPFVGPFVFSPIKAVVSLAQMIMGVALTIIGAYLTVINPSWQSSKEVIESGVNHVFSGCLSMIYSLTNIATCGLAGLSFELIVGSARS